MGSCDSKFIDEREQRLGFIGTPSSPPLLVILSQSHSEEEKQKDEPGRPKPLP